MQDQRTSCLLYLHVASQCTPAAAHVQPTMGSTQGRALLRGQSCQNRHCCCKCLGPLHVWLCCCSLPTTLQATDDETSSAARAVMLRPCTMRVLRGGA